MARSSRLKVCGSRLAPVDDVERRAPLAKDVVTQYEGNTLLLSNMVLPGAEFRGLSPPQIPTDAGYFYFQAVRWGSVLKPFPSTQGAAKHYVVETEKIGTLPRTFRCLCRSRAILSRCNYWQVEAMAAAACCVSARRIADAKLRKLNVPPAAADTSVPVAVLEERHLSMCKECRFNRKKEPP